MNWPEDFVNRVVCGDAMELIPQIPDGSIDLVVTDPEYDLDVHKGSGRSTGVFQFKNTNIYERIGKTQRGVDVPKLLAALVPKMDKFQGYFWCSRKQIPLYINWATDQQFYFDLLVWCKSNPPPLNNNSLLPDLEYCVQIREPGAPRYTGEARSVYSKHYLSSRVDYKGNHPTPKPVELMSRHLLVSSKPGDVILDPFLGSGTTAVACMKLNRRFIGFEIVPKHCEEAEQRLAQRELF